MTEVKTDAPVILGEAFYCEGFYIRLEIQDCLNQYDKSHLTGFELMKDEKGAHFLLFKFKAHKDNER